MTAYGGLRAVSRVTLDPNWLKCRQRLEDTSDTFHDPYDLIFPSHTGRSRRTPKLEAMLIVAAAWITKHKRSVAVNNEDGFETTHSKYRAHESHYKISNWSQAATHRKSTRRERTQKEKKSQIRRLHSHVRQFRHRQCHHRQLLQHAVRRLQHHYSLIRSLAVAPNAICLLLHLH